MGRPIVVRSEGVSPLNSRKPGCPQGIFRTATSYPPNRISSVRPLWSLEPISSRYSGATPPAGCSIGVVSIPRGAVIMANSLREAPRLPRNGSKAAVGAARPIAGRERVENAPPGLRASPRIKKPRTCENSHVGAALAEDQSPFSSNSTLKIIPGDFDVKMPPGIGVPHLILASLLWFA